MANNKKSFVLYCDLIHTVNQLPNESAGMLFKHILSYVNDENPSTDDMIVKIAFEPVKQQLKRDLKKYEKIKIKRSEAGKKSAEVKQQNSTKSTSVESVQQTPTKSTVNDNVNVNVNDNVINIKKLLLSEIEISDFIKDNYTEITVGFWNLFKANTTELGGNLNQLNKANGLWIDHVRKMIEIDKIETEQLRTVYEFLKVDEFWKQNILSTKKLREKFNTLLIKANKNGTKETKSTGKTAATRAEIGSILSKKFDHLQD